MSIIIYDGNQNDPDYAISANADRPSWPVDVKKVLLERFLETDYADITLRELLESNEDAWEKGVIQALDRRHIVSWDHIKTIVVYAAHYFRVRRGNNDPMKEHLELLLTFFHADQEISQGISDHAAGQYNKAASSFSNAAKAAYLSTSNLWIGPSSGNRAAGSAFDIGVDDRGLTDAERVRLLQGTPWRGVERTYSAIKETINLQ